MSWTHFFDQDFAIKHGLHEAIIYDKLRGWLRHNAATGQNRHDGKTWTFNTRKAWQAQLPFLTEKQVRTALENLRSSGVVVVGNYNKNPWDRTLWYALADESELDILEEDARAGPEVPMEGPPEADACAQGGQYTIATRQQDNTPPSIPASAGTSSTPPSKQRGRTRSPEELAFHRDTWEKMEKVLGSKLEGTAHGVNLWRLIDFARKTSADDWKDLINTMLRTFLLLQRRQIRTKDNRFEEAPFTPSKVYYFRYEILEHMKVRVHENPFAKYAKEEAGA